MTLKRRISISIAMAFSILFGLAAVIIYYSFSSFRQEEFKGRLEEKALTTAKLLLEVKEVDKQLLKLVDRNTINKLYNEKTLVFDGNYRLIYSSIDDATIHWEVKDLKRLKRAKSFFRKDGDKDLLGVFYDFEKFDYYVLVAAEDKSGNNKLEFLLYSLIITFLSGTMLVWLLTYRFIKNLLQPLDSFQQQITNISVNKLNVHLEKTNANDEINLLTEAFNQMLLRIEMAFNLQKEFTANASHELRTPLTRIAFQSENMLQKASGSPEIMAYLKSINEDVHQLSDLVNSLLLLSKLNKSEQNRYFRPERVDEIIFDINSRIKKNEPLYELDFEIVENENFENTLEIFGIRSLLEIVFSNLIKNACLYSTDKKVAISLKQINASTLKISISNQGEQLSETEQGKLFEPFFRGKNATGIHGSGLGLRIVKRILDYHEATITYRSEKPNFNQFDLYFRQVVGQK